MNFDKFADCVVVFILVSMLFVKSFTNADGNATGIYFLYQALGVAFNLAFTLIVAAGAWHYLKLKYGDN